MSTVTTSPKKNPYRSFEEGPFGVYPSFMWEMDRSGPVGQPKAPDVVVNQIVVQETPKPPQIIPQPEATKSRLDIDSKDLKQIDGSVYRSLGTQGLSDIVIETVDSPQTAPSVVAADYAVDMNSVGMPESAGFEGGYAEGAADGGASAGDSGGGDGGGDGGGE